MLVEVCEEEVKDVPRCVENDSVIVASEWTGGTNDKEDCRPGIVGAEVREGVEWAALDIKEGAGNDGRVCELCLACLARIEGKESNDEDDISEGLDVHDLECSLRQVLWKNLWQNWQSDGLAWGLKVYCTIDRNWF